MHEGPMWLLSPQGHVLLLFLLFCSCHCHAPQGGGCGQRRGGAPLAQPTGVPAYVGAWPPRFLLWAAWAL